MISYKGLHHLLCAGVQPEQSLTLGDSLANQLRIDAFKISKNDQLLQACFIPNISFGIRVCLVPFLCRDAEQCNIQHICFIGVGKALTLWGHIRRDQYIFDCIRVDTVIDFCKCPIQVPSQRKTAIFVILQALIVLDDI